MKPALHHYLLAHTATLCIIVGIVGAIGWMFVVFYDAGALMWDWSIVGLILLTTVPVAGLGYIFGVAFLWRIFGWIAARIQGWPFAKGDEVTILAGKHKGRVTRIQAIYEPYGQVRLELGEEAKKSVTDVFCAVCVTRTHRAEKAHAAQAHPAEA